MNSFWKPPRKWSAREEERAVSFKAATVAKTVIEQMEKKGCFKKNYYESLFIKTTS